MRTLKKLTAWVLSLAMASSLLSGLALTASAEDTWAPTATSYTADFTNANELDKWNKVVSGPGATISDGVLWMGNGAKESYLLPVTKMENVVVEAEIVHTSGNNYFAILFGSDGTAANISKNEMKIPSTSTRGYLYSTDATRDSGKGSGYQWNIVPYQMDNVASDLYQSAKLRLVIHNKRLAAWRNDQLIYSYTLGDNYKGGYVGIENNYYAAYVKSVSVRPSTADDIVLNESFNTAGTHSFTELTATNKLTTHNWGTGSFSKNGGIMSWIDTNKATIGDHVFNASFTFGSTNNGATRYLSPVFGITENSDGSRVGYAVYMKINGDIAIHKVNITAAGGVTSSTLYGSASGLNTIAKFPDKLGAIGETPVLKMDTPWEYRHVLKNGTINVYLDDVLVCTATNDALKNITGYTGFFVSGMNSTLHYFGSRGVEDADLNRPSTGIANIIDVEGNKEILAGKILRFYTTSTVTDETTGETSVTESLYGTAYTDVNGKFDLDLGHNQDYLVKLHSTGTDEPVATTSIKYNALGDTFPVNFETEADFSVLFDMDFADNAGTDSSTNNNTVTFIEQAKTKKIDAFGGKEALVLDGVGDTARLDSISAFELSDADKLTVESVFIPRERDGVKNMAVVSGLARISGSKYGGYGIYVDQDSNGNDIISFRAYVGNNVLKTVNAECELNKVYHAAGVYDGSVMKLYLNGQLKASVAASGDVCSVTSITPAIGCEWYYLNDLRKFFFKGEIADVTVTNGAKKDADILESFNAYKTAGYNFDSEIIDDVTTSISFSNTVPEKGDTVTASVSIRNISDASKTLSVNMQPGYFAALTDGSNTKEITIDANSTQTVDFTYKLLEGGREPFKATISENGKTVATDTESLSVIGSGYYKSETHNHSTRSDGVNEFSENVLEGFATKNLSYAYGTEHNQYNYWNTAKYAEVSSAYNPKQFVAYMGAEFTSTQSHANVYELDLDFSTQAAGAANALAWNEASRANCFNMISENGVLSANKYNEFINTVVNEQGGYIYINHPFDPTFSCPDNVLKDMRNFTGIEIWNGAATPFESYNQNARNSWDKINSIGWGHVIGQAGTDTHGAVCFGNIQKIAYLDELSRSEIARVVADGNAISTNGPDVRFNINGAPMNGTAIVNDGKATLNIDVYDPMGDILEVKLIKNLVSGEYTLDNRVETVLFEKADDAEAIGTWSYNEEIVVSDNEFYRVEVTTAKSPYGTISSTGTTLEGEGSNKGWAFTNNIWIETDGESNNTNISSISSSNENVTLNELPTGIMYLAGTGNFALTQLNVIADGTVEKAVNDDLITITITADDGTKNVTEIYTVGDITVTEIPPITSLICNDAQVSSTTLTATVSVSDGAETLKTEGAKLILAVYNDNSLIGVTAADVSADDTLKPMTVTYNEQSDISKLSAKALLFRSFKDITSLCQYLNIELN